MILYFLILRVEEYNMGKVRRVKKIKKILRVEKIEEGRKLEETIAKIR